MCLLHICGAFHVTVNWRVFDRSFRDLSFCSDKLNVVLRSWTGDWGPNNRNDGTRQLLLKNFKMEIAVLQCSLDLTVHFHCRCHNFILGLAKSSYLMDLGQY